MAREIAKAYEPQQIEPRWAEYWVAEALFNADPKAPGPVFSIVIPPPNVTGSLHIGRMLLDNRFFLIDPRCFYSYMQDCYFRQFSAGLGGSMLTSTVASGGIRNSTSSVRKNGSSTSNSFTKSIGSPSPHSLR